MDDFRKRMAARLRLILGSAPLGLPNLADDAVAFRSGRCGQTAAVARQPDTAGALSIGEPRRAGVNLEPIPDEDALERILNEHSRQTTLSAGEAL